MTNCNINGLQSTDPNGAFCEVGVRVNQDFELAEHADQKITEISVNDRAQVGAAAFFKLLGTLFDTSRRRPAICVRPSSVPYGDNKYAASLSFSLARTASTLALVRYPQVATSALSTALSFLRSRRDQDAGQGH